MGDVTTSIAGTVAERHLRILLADEDKRSLESLADVLTSLGHEVTPFAVSLQEAIELVLREEPDLAMVVVDHDDEHGLALIRETVEYTSGPVLVQLRGSCDADLPARAAELGIAGFIESSDPPAVQAAIEVALRRYREARALTEKVEQLESALERRAVIERAKGILMERHSVDDREAFERLREHARSRGRPVIELARALLEGHGLLPR